MSIDPAAARRSGLAILGDVVVAPRAAFEALRDHTHWGWAFLAITVLGLIGGFLQIPAGEHVAAAVMQRRMATDPGLAGLSPERQQNMLHFATVTQQYAWLLFPLVAMIAILIATLCFLVANALAKGSGTFARLFGLAANVAVVNFGLGYLVIGLLARLRGAENFNSTQDLVRLLPSLALLAPGGSPKLVTFLAAINPLQIWSFCLIVLGLGIVARVPRGIAYAVAAIVTLGSAVAPVLAAQ